MKKEIKRTQEGYISLELNNKIHSKEAIISTTYKFTDRCYIYITSTSNSGIMVRFKLKDENSSGEKIADEFYNELIDEQLRLDIKRDTKQIREMIVRKAFFPFEKK